jgi:tetratricopeptide (TPR) repeat protein
MGRDRAFSSQFTEGGFPMRMKFIAVVAPMLAGAALLPIPAFSAGDGGSGGGGETVQQCRNGEVWDKQKQKCVPPKQGMIDDDSLYEAGRDLAKAGRYGEAITVLSLAADKSDPRILNYLGYSHRKMGRVLVGLGYYEEALRADPDYTLVREYLGEAHLQLGDVKAARTQLAEIEKRCGTGCQEYAELSARIAAFEKHG